MIGRIAIFFLAVALSPGAAAAATVSGVVSDPTGASVPDARVTLLVLATGQESTVETGADGRYTFETPQVGPHLVVVERHGFSEAARTVLVERPDDSVDVPVELEIGGVVAQVTVTAARAEREVRQIPLHVETMSAHAVRQTNPLSTGDALANAANITPVGNGPFGVRPRLRGLDSTRLLVLVDGERLNTARQATDRTGAEVGLISPDAISRMEIVNGAGTLLYGSDALAGTINIITNEPQLSATPQFQYGFNGFYSTNERGRRGTATLGYTGPQAAVRLQAGMEAFDDYTAGSFDVEDTRPLFSAGRLDRATPSTTTSASRSTRSPIRSTRRTSARRTRFRTRARAAISSTRRASSTSASGGGCACATSAARWTTSASPTSPSRTSSMPPRCRTAISTASRRATRRRRSRRGSPISR